MLSGKWVFSYGQAYAKAPEPNRQCRLSSGVERVIGNDEVDSSNLSGGTIGFRFCEAEEFDPGDQIQEADAQAQAPGCYPLIHGFFCDPPDIHASGEMFPSLRPLLTALQLVFPEMFVDHSLHRMTDRPTSFLPVTHLATGVGPVLPQTLSQPGTERCLP